jgi:hypothetical protein
VHRRQGLGHIKVS